MAVHTELSFQSLFGSFGVVSAVAGTQCAQLAIRESTKTNLSGFFWMDDFFSILLLGLLLGRLCTGGVFDGVFLAYLVSVCTQCG